ncbi:MAG: class I SAM-dependent methyltransferase [Pseudomonadales bacterium]|nr:class I SAM-dependent methyltransferase [Pseudomonadales bacterium]
MALDHLAFYASAKRQKQKESLRHIPSWALDLPINITAKENVLRTALTTVLENVTLTRINYVEQEIGEMLKQSGYQEGVKTFFIWEAVSQYLNEAAVHEVFAFSQRPLSVANCSLPMYPKILLRERSSIIMRCSINARFSKTKFGYSDSTPQTWVNFLKRVAGNSLKISAMPSWAIVM